MKDETPAPAGAWGEEDQLRPLNWSLLESAVKPPRTWAPCRRCGGRLLPSRTRWYERAMRLVQPRRPYRCDKCDLRCWR
jgi:hypothetical protein